MFLNVSNFTKLMKQAYKNGRLDVGDINDGLFLCSGFWVVWIDGRRVPNKIKAMVMELTGTLPEIGQLFVVSKDYPTPQGKLWEATYRDLLERKGLVDSKLIVTPLELFEHGSITLLQSLSGNVTGIKTEFLGMIDAQAIDYDSGESMPTGPCYYKFPSLGIYWYNDFGTAIVMPTFSKREALMDVLEYIQFKEDGSVERKFREFGEMCEGAAEQTADHGEDIEETDAEG